MKAVEGGVRTAKSVQPGDRIRVHGVVFVVARREEVGSRWVQLIGEGRLNSVLLMVDYPVEVLS